jgi:anti-anti-sigma factor
MEISLRLERSIPVLAMGGRLDVGGAAALDEKLLDIRAPHVVLDLSAVGYVSSMGVRSLISGEQALRKTRGGLLLAGLSPNVRRVLEMAGILGEFQHFATAAEAVEAAARAIDTSVRSAEYTMGDRLYRVSPAAAEPCAIEIWGPATDDPFAALATGGDPLDVTLDELGVAFGTGGLGSARSQDQSSIGEFVAIGNVAGVHPAGSKESDFVMAERTAEAHLCVRGAVGFAGPPTRTVELTGTATVRQAVEDLGQILGSQPLIGFVIRTKLAAIAGLYSPAAGLRAHGLTHDGSLKLEELRAVAKVGPDTIVRGGSIAVYLPAAVRQGPEKRLGIEVTDGTPLEAEWQQIIRRLYADCGRVILTQLTGGYMAKTFQVASYDREGRRLLPTVLKISTRELIAREEEAHRAWVQRFILNNSTVIMGTASEGEWSALRYNFLGVAGADSKLSWLLDYYRTRPVADVTAIFDRLYTKILKPWYGQPRWEPVRLYEEHTPLRLFPQLFEAAEQLFGITAEQDTIECPELGITLPNPFQFLSQQYPRRATQSRLWYQSIGHGDLNLRNVLVDELENLYVIDFSETKKRNIVADFARMESVLKFQIVPLETQEDLASMAEFEMGLEEPGTLEELPPIRYRGPRRAEVEKAHAVICRLRRHANTVTLFETDMTPYWLAALEWTYPIVCWDENVLRKKLSVYSAALVVRRMLQHEGGTAGSAVGSRG